MCCDRYKKRQAEAEADLESKRAAKKAKIDLGTKPDDGDPFGPPPPPPSSRTSSQSIKVKKEEAIVGVVIPESAQIDQGGEEKPSGLRPIGTPPESDPDKKV